MATTELCNSIRSMSLEEKTVALAVSIVMDRISRLSEADRNDLFMLVKELPAATTIEDRNGICDTMVEILDGRAIVAERVNLSEPGVGSERWEKWVQWVSKKVREARISAGLTQEQLAQKSGLPQSHISRIETGKHSPSRATLEKLAHALGRPVADFDHEAPRPGD